MKTMTGIALVDCNNFFVSCEKVFNPQLRNKPVVVLSSNDGCVVSRSNEAKQIGILMGAPAYQFQALITKYKVAVFSSNFSLYGEISRRVMQILEESIPEIQIYSIDEAFLFLNQFKENEFEGCMKELREKVYRYTGIPISIGISQTKTLAKVANRIAKKDLEKQGVYYLPAEKADSDLLKFPVEDLWGIGRKLSKKLCYYGVLTALDLKYANDEWLREKITIQGLRVASELRGINCSELKATETAQKTMVYSRSFGNYVYKLEELSEVASDYVSALARKLRKEKLVAATLVVWITTNRFSNTPRYSSSGSYNFQIASSYTPELITAAQNILSKIYKANYAYNKLAVIASGLSYQNEKQLSFLEQNRDLDKEKILMQTVDNLNSSYGKTSVFYASSGIKHHWQTRQLKRSPRFMSYWEEILVVKA